LVEVFVPKEKFAEAQELIEAFQNPENEVIDDESMPESPDDEESEG
jgi:hypothetical protein